MVDDDPDRGLVLCKGLLDQAFAVDLAADGSAALHKLFVNSYDLVILAVMLPVKDGHAVCRELRANGNDIPILMLTRDGLRHDHHHRGTAAGNRSAAGLSW